nr:putative ribonuclease H-like domain-containing protein [Tanacetum cinerariifolium]
MSHHTLYGVKPLLLYTATFKFTRDDLSESALWRNIGDEHNLSRMLRRKLPWTLLGLKDFMELLLLRNFPLEMVKVEYLEKVKSKLEHFNDVYFYKELKYNLFNVSQICDKKNNVLFTDTECLVLSSNFKLLDESQVLLRVLRKDNIYSVDLKSVVPTGGLTYLFAKATIDESNLWHMRLRKETNTKPPTRPNL